MLNPYFVFIQNVVANVMVISHNSPNKRLPIFFVISFKLYHIYDKVESVMMKSDFVFDDVEPLTSLWVPDTAGDTAELARVADIAIDKNIRFVSMPARAVKTFWPWVEGKNIKILTRFDFEIDTNKDVEDVISVFAKNITGVFRAGADGAQIFVPAGLVAQFADLVYPIRNDLFFDKYLSITIDIDNMENSNWSGIFDAISRIKPDSILVFGNVEKFNANSDFVGRIFDMLESWNLNSDLHLMLGKNMLRVTQTLRLVEKMRPGLLKNMRVFVEK